MTTIRTIQPMKLAKGSYRIIGIPAFARSLPGPYRYVTNPQMAIMPSKVTADVASAYQRTFRKTWRTSVVVVVIYFTENQPTRKPNRIQKMGTPIPIPMQILSRTTKIRKTQTGFFVCIHFMCALLGSDFFVGYDCPTMSPVAKAIE